MGEEKKATFVRTWSSSSAREFAPGPSVPDTVRIFFPLPTNSSGNSSIMNASEPLISVTGLGFSFDKPVLRDLSFEVRRSEFVSFVGPSGCGKTTLLYVLLGLHDRYEGTIDVRCTHSSFVFQHETLLEWRTALANVMLPFELEGSPASDAVREKARNALALVGLSGYEDRFPGELSGGMKKRVEIARALVTEPQLLILDEPFSSLDIITRERLNILIGDIHRKTNQTVVMVTHSVEEACFLSDTVYVLSNAPATIIRTEHVDRTHDIARDHFSLSDDENRADRAIRDAAKSLWTTGPEQPATQEPARGRAGERLPARTRLARSLKSNYNIWLVPLEVVAVFLLLSAAKRLFSVPDYIFPAPTAILTEFFATLANGTILPHIAATLYESSAGFAIAFVLTLLLGYGIAKFRLFSNLAMPHLIALNTIPAVALAPFLVLWLPTGYPPKIVTAVILMFFPMLINNISAIRMAGERMGTLIRFYRPRAVATFIKFEFPAALPMVFSGIKVSITLSVIGAVVGEYVSGQYGLGSLVNTAKAMYNMPLMYVCLVWLGLLGLSYFGIASAIYALIMKARRRKP